MASQSDGADSESDKSEKCSNLTRSPPKHTGEKEVKEDHIKKAEETDEDRDEDDDNDEDEDEDEEEEPLLKYAALTRGQGSIYRNGDAASAFLVAGDKMIIGTHNGYVHVLSLPSFQSLRAYHAHSASVTGISISPNPPPLPVAKSDALNRVASERPDLPSKASARSTAAKGGRRPVPVPNVPSNAIHIATSSIDGNVCIFSLVDEKDVLLRNFGRPVQSVALSPEFKNDRSYISGGKAGSLILTVGGRAGSSANANISGAAAAAAGWLNTMGIGSNNGTDTKLHSGEGAISTIKWSLSGRFVVWVNEYGIKIMRSNLHLDSHESELAWKRMSHIDRPSTGNWSEMAGVWKARAEWVSEEGLEKDEDDSLDIQHSSTGNGTEAEKQSLRSVQTMPRSSNIQKKERLIVGWGNCIWIVDVTPNGMGVGRNASERKLGRVDILNVLRTDCIVSGVSLYTPNLLLVLAYVIPEKNDNQEKGDSQQVDTPRRGIHRRNNALQPEMRIIRWETEEEAAVPDTLKVSRYESLSAPDYHLGILPVARGPIKIETQRGALEVIGGMGASIWDATMYPARLFTSAASVRSFGSTGDRPSSDKASTTGTIGSFVAGEGPHPALLTRGIKIFIQSPYDCVLATKPTKQDHLAWLDEHHKYEEAWNLLDQHPESAGGLSEEDSGVSTPTMGQLKNAQMQSSLAEFFADDTSNATGSNENKFSKANKDKRRIGKKWIEQLVNEGEWTRAGEVCGFVLDNAASWEHWVFTFAEANKFEEITPYIPDEPQIPPVSPTVYEVILGYYVSEDRQKLAELLNNWQPELFDVDAIIGVIESRLNVGDIRENTIEDGTPGRDWRILTGALAKLYLANGRANDALKCYIKLQDANAAMALIATHHLVDTVADDIPGLILLRVPKDSQNSASIEELDRASKEPVRLLVTEARQGVVRPETVLKQLSIHKNMRIFKYFYLRDLWNGEIAESEEITKPRRSRFDAFTNPLVAEGRSLVNDSADTALSLFAEYNRELLFDFLRLSQSYTLSTATTICEKQNYLPELVYLLAKEGQMKRALRTIIDRMGDVSRAIAFAKEQNDSDLWNDLLNYSMNKPTFIRALLEEVGTAINPINVVRRIPEGLEVPGLRDALIRMLKEHELQHSISEGVVRVFRGEIAIGMDSLRLGQKRAVKFDIVLDAARPKQKSKSLREVVRKIGVQKLKAGFCSGCNDIIDHGEKDALLSFPCMHAFHLSCFLVYESMDTEEVNEKSLEASATDATKLASFPSVEALAGGENGEDFGDVLGYGIGPKVKFAKDLRTDGKIKPRGGCPLEVHHRGDEQI